MLWILIVQPMPRMGVEIARGVVKITISVAHIMQFISIVTNRKALLFICSLYSRALCLFVLLKKAICIFANKNLLSFGGLIHSCTTKERSIVHREEATISSFFVLFRVPSDGSQL